MSDEAQRWKEKYLKSIEQQEKLERRWDARLDLLRRGWYAALWRPRVPTARLTCA